MTEALTTDLARMETLQVISRSSSAQYKATKKPLSAIAAELHADAIVEGSVQRSGDRVRITAQLIRAATDKHIWAESYERDFRDVLALQDDVARDIAGQIQVRVTPEEKVLLTTAPVLNSEAYDAYLKSRQFIFRRTPEGARKRVEYAEHALTLQPDNAILQRVWETP